MRVFLSHSSSNKDFVRQVFEAIGPANAEFDEATFAAGSFNTIAIEDAISRCNLFALFATPESIESGYVTLDIKYAMDYLAKKQLQGIISFCMHGIRPEQLPDSLRMISAVRHTVQPGTCARFLMAELIQLERGAYPNRRPYVGREDIGQRIKARLAAPDEKTPLALILSGVDGVGRRTLASKVLADIYPGIGSVSPITSIRPNSDLRDLYRSLLDATASHEKAELFRLIAEFDAATDEQRLSTIVAIIRSLHQAKEVLVVIDDGGALDEDGRLVDYLSAILNALKCATRLRPYLVFILFRTPPGHVREPAGTALYFRVDALDSESVKQLISLHIKTRGETATSEEINKIVELTDGHPYNVQFLLQLLDTYDLATIIEDPSDLVAFKKKQGDEFVDRLNLTPTHRQVIGFIRLMSHSPIDLIATALDITPDVLAKTLRELEEFHCIDRVGRIYSLNRQLRLSFQRSSKFRLSPGYIANALTRVVAIYDSYKNEDSVPVELISAASRAALSIGRDDASLQAFLLPSNSIFVGRQFYDLKKYEDCARVCRQALVSQRFLNESAWLEAVRLRCLSLARLGDGNAFNATLSLLDKNTSKSGKRIKAFLEGFWLRLGGDPAAAIEKFKRAHALGRKSYFVLRELSHALMVTGQTGEARKYAEDALDIVPSNPYIIDQVLSLRVREMPRVTEDILYDPQISGLLERLERYGDEEGKSFYAIRMADIYRQANKLDEALQFAQRASRRTPTLFAAHALEGEILLRMNGRMRDVENKLAILQRLLDDKSTGDGKTHLPEFIVLKAEYLIGNHRYREAIDISKANESRLRGRITELKRKIAFAARETSGEISDRDRKWLTTEAGDGRRQTTHALSQALPARRHRSGGRPT